jgi:hypothetical protein
VARLLALCVAALALASVSAAATFRGSARADRIAGTARADFIDPAGGRDVVRAAAGADRISVESDGLADRVTCGSGPDIVSADEADVVGPDCEVVTRRVSRDVLAGGEGQHATEVEPGSAAAGATVVTVFQMSRIHNGGAMDIGFATSTDGGAHWRSGRLPGVGAQSVPPGMTSRVTDPVVTFDAVHGVWLAATLALAPGSLTQLLVSRSADGLTWDAPVVAAGISAQSLAYDKEWLACDAGAASPFRGRCYLAYTEVATARLAVQVSTDGGRTWSPAVTVTGDPGVASPEVVGVQPLVRPDGAFVVVYETSAGIAAIRSTDGGRTFDGVVRVAEVRIHRAAGMRAPPLPSAAVDSAGRVYAVWPDCRFRAACGANDVVLASSADGAIWEEPRRLPLTDAVGTRDLFLPAIAVDSDGRIAVAYYALQASGCTTLTCRIDAFLATTRGGAWTVRRLTARSLELHWLADTEAGRMLGDYVALAFVLGRPLPVFAAASPPAGSRLREAIYATTTLK